VFIVPLSVLTATYSGICREIWLHAGRSPQSQQGKCSPLISRAKTNAVKQMVAVLSLYVVCSTPFISMQLWFTWDPQAHTRPFFNGMQRLTLNTPAKSFICPSNNP
jgi:arginine vasopressin receptor 1A